MATPTAEEIQEIWEEETKHSTHQEDFEDNYSDIVKAGNNSDDDD